MLLESFQSYAQGDPALLRDQEGVASVTAGALYRWMLDRHVFPRDSKESNPLVLSYDVPGEVGSRLTSEVYCSFCGLGSLQHLNMKSESPSMTAVTICSEAYSRFQRLQTPLVDVKLWMASMKRISAQMKGLSHRHSNAMPAASSAGYVAIAHPQILEYLISGSFSHRMRGYRLAPISEGQGTFLLDRLGHSLEAVNDKIAPIALLAVVFRLFVQDLVRNGILAARAMGARVRSNESMCPVQASGGILPVSGPEDMLLPQIQVLTPPHILSVLRGELESQARFSGAVCRLGVGSDGHFAMS